MRIKTINIDPVNVDADGIAQAQAVAGAGNLTLNGALISGGVFTGDYARQISITSDGDDSGRTFTVTGTDADGKAQTEAITGPNTTSVESTKYWKTITSIAADAACAGNISAGTVDEFVTNTIPLDRLNSDPATISIENFTGTIQAAIDETFTDIQNDDNFEFYEIVGPTQVALSGYTTNHAAAIRVRVESYTNGADFRVVINQNRAR